MEFDRDPPPDFAQCQGEYLSAYGPDRVGPPPKQYRCPNVPEWLLADPVPPPSVRGVQYEAFVMSACRWCRKNIRAGYSQRGQKLPPELALTADTRDVLESAYMLGGGHGLLEVLEQHLAVDASLYSGWVDQFVRWCRDGWPDRTVSQRGASWRHV